MVLHLQHQQVQKDLQVEAVLEGYSYLKYSLFHLISELMSQTLSAIC